MRENRTPPRGEAARIAARVRALLNEADGSEADGAEADGAERLADGAVRVDGAVPPVLQAVQHRGGHGSDARPTLWDRVSARVPVRLDPGRRSAVAVGLAVLLAAVVTGMWLMSSRPQAVPVSASVPSVPGAGALVGTDGVTEGATPTSASPTAAAARPTAAAKLVIDVAGKVRRPGVYRLPGGSRVDDAIQAAGGPVGHVDLSTLNLAAPLVDGQQVAVGVPVAADGAPGDGVVAGGATTDGGTAAAGTIVDLNSATLEQLETLPGVGPVLGQDILDYRNAHGSFTDIEQLQDVSGIGDVRFAQLKPLVSV